MRAARSICKLLYENYHVTLLNFGTSQAPLVENIFNCDFVIKIFMTMMMNNDDDYDYD